MDTFFDGLDDWISAAIRLVTDEPTQADYVLVGP